MRNTRPDGGIALRLIEVNQTFFAWLTGPLAQKLHPHRQNVFVRNIPNLLSVGRCIAAVWVDWQIFHATSNQERWLYLVIIIALVASDGIDGALARRLKIESRFGAMADPFADKILIGGLIIGLSFKLDSQLFTGLVIALLAIEVGNMIVGIIGSIVVAKLNHPKRAGAGTWGKLKFACESLLVFLGWALLSYKEVALTISLLLIIMVIPLALRSLLGYIEMIRKGLMASRPT